MACVCIEGMKLTCSLGRNVLLRIQMLNIIRDKIVPSDWEEAKKLEIPRVTGSPPASWWKADEDRDLLLGILKHGYQQYLAIRNDPEFCFYGKKYDDSQSDGVDDDESKNDDALETEEKKPIAFGTKEEDSDYEEKNEEETDEEEYAGDNKPEVFVWPSKADIGMRLRRIIAAFVRERASTTRKRRTREGPGRQRSRQPAQRQRGQGAGRRTKKRKVDEAESEVKDASEEQSPEGDASAEMSLIDPVEKKEEEPVKAEQHLPKEEPHQLDGTIEQPLVEKREEMTHLDMKEEPVLASVAAPLSVEQNTEYTPLQEHAPESSVLNQDVA